MHAISWRNHGFKLPWGIVISAGEIQGRHPADYTVMGLTADSPWYLLTQHSVRILPATRRAEPHDGNRRPRSFLWQSPKLRARGSRLSVDDSPPHAPVPVRVWTVSQTLNRTIVLFSRYHPRLFSPRSVPRYFTDGDRPPYWNAVTALFKRRITDSSRYSPFYVHQRRVLGAPCAYQGRLWLWRSVVAVVYMRHRQPDEKPDLRAKIPALTMDVSTVYARLPPSLTPPPARCSALVIGGAFHGAAPIVALYLVRASSPPPATKHFDPGGLTPLMDDGFQTAKSAQWKA